jgi:4'-phosphopantetheinyl transferase
MGRCCHRTGEASVEVCYSGISALRDEQPERLLEFLSPEERSRAARFVFPKDRGLFIAAHALLRSRLGKAAGAGRLEFQADRHGKPALNPPHGNPPLLFNLSHTNGLAACVLARGCAVGIDAEEIVPRSGLDAIARWAFTEEERRIIAASSGDKRLEAFYRLWTLKEALVKGIGRGLSLDLQDIAFMLEPLTLSIATRIGEDASCWRMLEFAPTGEHRMAVAIKVPPGNALTVTVEAIAIGDLAPADQLREFENG